MADQSQAPTIPAATPATPTGPTTTEQPGWMGGLLAPEGEIAPVDDAQPATPPQGSAPAGAAAAEAEGTGQGASKASAVAPAEGAEGEEAADPTKTVPHAALHEERRRRQALEGELTAARRTVQDMEQSFARFVAIQAREREQLIQARQGPAAAEAEAPPPSFDDDPRAAFNAAMARIDQLSQQLQQVNQADARRQQGDVQNERFNALRQHFAADEQAYIAEGHADYPAAVQHAARVRTKQLEIAGLRPDQIQRTIGQEIGWLVENAVANNRRPAEVLYQFAKEMGFSGAAPAPAAAAAGNGAAAPASGQAQLEATRRTQRAAPAGGQSEAAAGDMTLEALSRIQDPAKFKAEFTRMLQPARLRQGFRV